MSLLVYFEASLTQVHVSVDVFETSLARLSVDAFEASLARLSVAVFETSLAQVLVSVDVFETNLAQVHVSVDVCPWLLLSSYFCHSNNMFNFSRSVLTTTHDYDRMIATQTYS